MVRKIVFILVLVSLILPTAVRGAIPASERAALIALYNSTNGDGWKDNSGWKTPPLDTDGFAMPGTENTWHGVTVNNDHVIRLTLLNKNLTGTIPPDIGDLGNMTYLNLSSNNLTGTLPAQLFTLASLSSLSLSSNSFSGITLDDFLPLTNLSNLELNSCNISGTIPAAITTLSKLSYLLLNSNNLSGSLPPELGNMTSLSYLWLSGNNLKGALPPEMGNLTQLSSLNLGSNSLSGTLPAELGNMTGLRSLTLSYNHISGPIPSGIGNLTQLTMLNLANNQFYGSIPTTVKNLVNLQFLHLDDNWLSGNIPPEVGNLTKLKFLYLGSNSLTGAIPPELGNMSDLMIMELDFNYLSGSIPGELGNLDNLMTMDLKSNRLTGTVPAELADMAKIQTLRLSRNKLTGNIPEVFTDVGTLRYFYLGANNLVGPLPSSLTKLSGMFYIELSNNGFYTTDPQLESFLEVKSPFWSVSQTIAPSDLSGTADSASSVTLNWTPIEYSSGTGSYRVYSSTTPGGSYSLAAETNDKSASSITVSGLNANTTYYFVIETKTAAGSLNQNTVYSDYSTEISVTTLPGAVQQFRLTVKSSPGSGASVTVSPADLNGDSGGTTTFTRDYAEGTGVTLTAPVQHNGQSFSKWLVDGAADTDTSVTVTMSSDHTLTAVFEEESAPDTYTLTVKSTPGGGAITVNPADNNGNGGGTATFTREYTEGAGVTLTAPAQHSGQTFSKWVVDGAADTNKSVTVTMNGDHTLTAVYKEEGTPDTYTLTVESSPSAGAPVTVTPADFNGSGNGTTSFTREYTEGTGVTLTAPASYEGQSFLKWLVDGAADTNKSVTVTMNGDHTLTAVYEEESTPDTYTLTVESSPSAGAPVTVTPADVNGNGNGTTSFTRNYTEGATVTLTAPAEYGGSVFSGWYVDGTLKTGDRTTQVAMTAGRKARANYTTVSSPVLELGRETLNFGCIGGGAASPSQAVRVTIHGTPVDWSAETGAAWLRLTPASGTGTARLDVSILPDGLSAGKYTGSITVTAPGADDSPQSVTVTLNVYGSNSTTGPVGDFSTPTDGSSVYSSIPVTGWAVDEIGVESVKIYREGRDQNDLVYIGDAVFVEGARPDVEALYPEYPENHKAGWGYMLLTHFLPNGGNGTFTLHAAASDVEGNTVTLGTKTIKVDNANAVKPFGAIDTPTQGGAASGSGFVNGGWVLTPQPNTIPTDGSTIDVYVDGVKLGHPDYNIYREDIASFFPGYANAGGAAARFTFDTTGYEDGIHTILWVAADSAGNADGIGSRYFAIDNAGVSSGASRGARASGASAAYDVQTNYEPMVVKKGFAQNAEPEIVFPDNHGRVVIRMKELGRLEVHLNETPLPLRGSGTLHHYGYLSVNGQRRLLPAGSFMDMERGIFYWQPGFAFYGRYNLEFITRNAEGEMTRKRLTVDIRARH